MIIKFIKKHPVGIAKGTVTNTDEIFAKRMIETGFAKKSTKKEFEAFKKSIKDAEIERLRVIEEIHYLEQEAKNTAVTTVEKDCGCSGKVADCEECKDKK